MPEFPRWVHQSGGLMRLVVDDADAQQACADGWSLVPVALLMVKGDERTAVYTAEALTCALTQGWALTSVETEAPIVKPKAKKAK